MKDKKKQCKTIFRRIPKTTRCREAIATLFSRVYEYPKIVSLSRKVTFYLSLTSWSGVWKSCGSCGWVVESIWTYGCPPNHRLKNRVFHYFNHPFWGCSPYFWKHPYRNRSLEEGTHPMATLWVPASCLCVSMLRWKKTKRSKRDENWPIKNRNIKKTEELGFLTPILPDD